MKSQNARAGRNLGGGHNEAIFWFAQKKQAERGQAKPHSTAAVTWGPSSQGCSLLKSFSACGKCPHPMRALLGWGVLMKLGYLLDFENLRA
jgi:hypothetical protein